MRLGVGVLLLLVVLHGKTPRRVVIARHRTALRTGLYVLLSQPLQCPRLFEAPMPSLFHVELPVDRDNPIRAGSALYRRLGASADANDGASWHFALLVKVFAWLTNWTWTP